MHAYQKYQRVNISTADPLRIVIMLYEGGIRNLNQALRLVSTEGAEFGEKIGKTLEIINYLRGSLDAEKGGEIAANLRRLYDYVRDQLSRASIQREAAPIQESISLLQTLLEGWRGIQPGQNAGDRTTVHDTNATELMEPSQMPPSQRPPSMPAGGLSMVG